MCHYVSMDTPTTTNGYLTTSQAAAYLGYSSQSFRNLRDKGRTPPHVKTPTGGYRYKVEDLEAWMQNGPQEGKNA